MNDTEEQLKAIVESKQEPDPFEVNIPDNLAYIPTTLNKLFGRFLQERRYVINGEELKELPKGVEGSSVLMKVSPLGLEYLETLSIIEYLGSLLEATIYVMQNSNIHISEGKTEVAASLTQQLEDAMGLVQVFQILGQSLERELNPDSRE